MMKTFFDKINGLKKNERGSTALEYGLIMSLMFLVIVASISRMANNIDSRINHVANTVGTAR